MLTESDTSNLTANDDDLAAIQRVMAGEADAFEVVLRKYSPRVFALVGRKIPQADIESVSQDVFLSAFRSLGTYEALQPFEHWLARIVRRRCCDYWRERERRDKVEFISMDGPERPGLALDVMAAVPHSGPQNEGRSEAGEQLQRALAGLNAEDRALLEGVYFEEVPLKEMAVTLGWSLVKTKVRAFRARSKLRVMMDAMSGSEGRR